jgi:hypothetical protein
MAAPTFRACESDRKPRYHQNSTTLSNLECANNLVPMISKNPNIVVIYSENADFNTADIEKETQICG